MWERPVRIGDFLEVGSMLGTVEAINTRSTHLKRVDGVRLLIPNSSLLENTVINWTLVDRVLRSTVRVGVAYGTDVIKVRELLEQVASENGNVLEEPAPTVVFEDFGDSSLVFDLYFWIQTTRERSLRNTRSQLRFAITELFQASDVTIAFPQRDVHIDGSIDLVPASRDQGQG
jgi:small-conductance mechanosensitive channel